MADGSSRIDAARILAWREPDAIQSYSARDTILYNLGVGAGLIEDALPFVWEERLTAMPSMASILANDRPWMLDPDFGIDVSAMVHGAQSVTLYGALPAEGTVVGRTRVVGLWDNGPGRGAVLELEKHLYLDQADSPVACVRSRIVCRADGGFGGPHRASSAAPMNPERPADIVAALRTRPDQALIYRLSGDTHALHVDPVFARLAGFERPILHGLATFGIAGLLITHHLCGGDAAALRHIDARFSAPVYPGDELQMLIWRMPQGEAYFRCLVGDVTVLDQGYALIG